MSLTHDTPGFTRLGIKIAFAVVLLLWALPAF